MFGPQSVAEIVPGRCQRLIPRCADPRTVVPWAMVPPWPRSGCSPSSGAVTGFGGADEADRIESCCPAAVLDTVDVSAEEFTYPVSSALRGAGSAVQAISGWYPDTHRAFGRLFAELKLYAAVVPYPNCPR